MNPWSIAVNVLAIVVYLMCVLAIAAVSAATIWSLRRIDKTLAPAMLALVAMEKPLAKMVETLESVSEVASELKDLKEGDLRILQALVKSTAEMRLSVEEFHAAVFSGPEKVQRRRSVATGVDEQAEILAEKRRAEGAGIEGAASMEEFLEARGKHGGVV